MKRGALGVVLGCLVLFSPGFLPAQTQYPPEVLEAYAQCQERHDLDAVRELIWYHHNVERVDASVWGLPKDDFDDRQPLTIQERLDHRAARELAGAPMATHGPVQYPHHLRHSLDRYNEAEGIRPDCSAILAAAGVTPPEPDDLSAGWASDLNVTSTDTNKRGEVHVAVDPGSPNRLLVTSVPSGGSPEYVSSYKAFSTDYGQTWSRGGVGNNAGSTWECDPVSYYQRSTGWAYHAKLACNNGSCNTWYNTRVRYSTNGGATFTDCASRPGSETFQDREWMVIDNTPSSPCYGTIYVTWNSQMPGSYNQERVVSSTDNCATFGTPSSVSGISAVLGADLAVGPDGHAYAFWGNFNQNYWQMRGSNDCGTMWFAPNITNVKPKYSGVQTSCPAQCVRGIGEQPALGVDVALTSAFYGRLYAVMPDMNQDGCRTASTRACLGPEGWDANWSDTCNYDIWLSTSDDHGSTWSPAVNLTAHEGNLVDHIMPWARVDPVDGSLYIGYHRSRLNPTAAVDRQRTHYFVIRSTDGGATFEPAVQASTLEGDERVAGADSFERGDYQGVDVYEGVAWPVWVDRRGETGSAGEEEIIIRKLCSEPSHWSERAPAFTTPAVTAVDYAPVIVSWDPPDLYWGDGGENPAARTYQLWVDGALVEDGIPYTASSTSYSPGDDLNHTYVVRAVNQCGVAKDYLGVTHGPGIFLDDFESGTTNAWSNVLP